MAKHINIKDKKKFAVLVIAVVAVITAIAIIIAVSVGKKNKADEELPQSENDKVVADCINALKEHWTETYNGISVLYQDGTFMAAGEEDRILEIKNVRIITVNSEAVASASNIKYIVEFDLYSNRYRTKPYLVKEDIFNTAVVYTNGHIEILHTNTFEELLDRSTPDSIGVSNMVKSVEDLGDAYNCRIDLD